MFDDEREGLPSASGMGEYWLCEGKFLAEKDLPPSPPNAATIFGERVHDILAGSPITQEDSKEVLEMVETMKRIRKEVGRAWSEVRGGVPKKVDAFIELRHWLKNGDEKVMSGKADIYYAMEAGC